jgi:hypothetical protein
MRRTVPIQTAAQGHNRVPFGTVRRRIASPERWDKLLVGVAAFMLIAMARLQSLNAMNTSACSSASPSIT